MYDKFVAFVDDLLGIGVQLERTQKSYEGALNKLHSGTGNLVNRAEKMKQLGAKAAKSLPKEVLQDEDTSGSDNVDLVKQIA